MIIININLFIINYIIILNKHKYIVFFFFT